MGIRDKIARKLEELSTCPGCRHSESAGVPGCRCTRTDCACNPAVTNWGKV
ncbi:MAG: hypothetical protein ACRD0P_29125 [Stackebrandtia sp.]